MDKLQEILVQLAKSNPQLLEGIENAAVAGMKNDKVALYNIFVKENSSFVYDKLDELLSRHDNQRLDINWNKEDYIYRIVVSKRKKIPEKVRKQRLPKELLGGDNGTASNPATTSETEGAGTKD